VANLTITPNSDVAKYQILRADGKLEIASREGSINVNDGAQTTTLDTGKVISFSAGNDCAAPATAPDQASAPDSSKPVSLSKGKIAAIVLGAAAAGGVGLALALSHGGGSRPPVSPSVP
jgi:ferric-dicitrate binding protein FerR (iron transport regulator)